MRRLAPEAGSKGMHGCVVKVQPGWAELPGSSGPGSRSKSACRPGKSSPGPRKSWDQYLELMQCISMVISLFSQSPINGLAQG